MMDSKGFEAYSLGFKNACDQAVWEANTYDTMQEPFEDVPSFGDWFSIGLCVADLFSMFAYSSPKP